MARFTGKNVIVTGAGRGTGAVIAERFRAEDANVVAADVRPGEGIVSLDVTEEQDWARVVADVGRVDVLVNNAAVLHMGPIEHTSVEDCRRVLDVNLVGPYLGIRAVLGSMRDAGGGAVVNVGSIDGEIGMNGVSAYGASKWGLRGLTRCAALELGRDGIRVNTVNPAGGNPEMFSPWFGQMQPFMEQTLAYTLNRGIPGEVPLESIAAAVLFLASDDAGHITGCDLPVDGGAAAGRFIEGFNTLR